MWVGCDVISLVDMFMLQHVYNCCSFDDDAEEKCGEYCTKAIEYCPSNPEAYQLMGSYLLSKQDIEVIDHCNLFPVNVDVLKDIYQTLS